MIQEEEETVERRTPGGGKKKRKEKKEPAQMTDDLQNPCSRIECCSNSLNCKTHEATFKQKPLRKRNSSKNFYRTSPFFLCKHTCYIHANIFMDHENTHVSNEVLIVNKQA